MSVPSFYALCVLIWGTTWFAITTQIEAIAPELGVAIRFGLAYLTLAGSVVTFGAFYALVHRIGPARAGYIGVLTPVVALVVSSAFEGFAWTGETVAGVALAIAGNVIAMWQPRPPRPVQDSSTTTGA